MTSGERREFEPRVTSIHIISTSRAHFIHSFILSSSEMYVGKENRNFFKSLPVFLPPPLLSPLLRIDQSTEWMNEWMNHCIIFKTYKKKLYSCRLCSYQGNIDKTKNKSILWFLDYTSILFYRYYYFFPFFSDAGVREENLLAWYSRIHIGSKKNNNNNASRVVVC
jgi:hypothetical protein